MSTVVALTLATLATSGCQHDPDKYLITATNVKAYAAVELSAPSAPADGVTRVLITVTLADKTDVDKRVVQFKTTIGTLYATAKNGTDVTENADSTGVARVELQSATTAGTAHIDVIVGSVLTISKVVEFTPLTGEDAFDASLEKTALTADGFSKARLTVTLRKVGPTEAQRQVKFETTLGLLLAPGQPPKTVQTVTADSSGVAFVDIETEKITGTCQVLVTALGVQRSLSLQFLPRDSSRIITLSASPPRGEADGATPVRIVASINPDLNPAVKTVKFSATSPGRLTETSVDASGSNQAFTYLTSSATGTIPVVATVDGTNADVVVVFDAALPSRVYVAPDDVELHSGDQTTIRVMLLRDVGSVSDNLSVEYDARTTAGAKIGTLNQITLAKSGTSTAVFRVGTTAYTGDVTITATAQGGVVGVATITIR